MKSVFRITLLITSLALAASTGLQAQRVIKGTVYNNGEPAAGVNVEAHRGSSMMTSFDGKYEVKADDRTKWIRFTSVTTSRRVDVPANTNEFDYAFDGKIPGESEDEGDGVVLKSAEELIKDQDREFMNQMSMFNEFYKQDNFESALPHWKELFNKYPKSTINLYIRGVTMYEQLIEEADTPAERDKYIDDLMRIYEKRIRHFGEKGYVLGRKATHWLKYKLEDQQSDVESAEFKETMKKGYDWIVESVKEQGNKTELPVLVLLMQTSRSLFMMNEIPKESVVNNYNTSISILESIRASKPEPEVAKSVNDVHVYVEEIFGQSGAADCEALVSIFAPQFENNRNDAEFVKNMLRRLRNAKCDESPLFAQATDRLYELEPSSEAAYNMARRALRNDDIQRAKDFYMQAIEQEKDREQLSRLYYEYALVIFAKDHDLQGARKFAQQALEIKPNYCEALVLIGDIYIAASRNFGANDFESRSVFWVAVDYYERARSQPDCAMDASKKINDYRKHFPSKEEAFFLGLQEGQTYKVGGWINETTKIRF
jgi:tetratricopeptide (TPR) repeat protein